MKRPLPIDREREFNVDDMFYSTTDLRGLITSGNSVFARISGYPLSTLVGAPHSIVRHPDMPKAVFKLLWDTIQAGQSISAYVKNLAADGAYYWVLATVFPIDEGYLSVRIKPTSALFAHVPGIYAKVLEDEKKNGLESSEKLLLKILCDVGFSGYDSFMNRALSLEMKEHSARKASGFRTRSETTFACIFGKLQAFASLSEILTSSITEMKLSFQGLRSLSLNMSLSACHLGKAANTLAVVADSFQNFSIETEQEVIKFQKILNEVRVALRMSEYFSCAAYLQNQMIDFFVAESKEQGVDTCQQQQQLKIVSEMLLDKCKTILEQTHDILKNFSSAASTTEASITALEIVRQTGKVEAAQVSGAMEAIGPYLVDLQKCTKTLRTPLRKIAENSEGLVGDVEIIQDHLSIAKAA